MVPSSLGITLSYASASQPDACMFMGLRLTKSPSFCNGGICENLGIHRRTSTMRTLDGDLPDMQVLTCKVAESERNAILGDFARLDTPWLKRPRRAASGKPAVVRDVLEMIREHIDPSFRALVLMDKPVSQSVISKMMNVENALMTMRSNPAFWAAHSASIAQSSELAELNKLWEQLLEKSLDAPTSYDYQKPLIWPMVHFIMDLASIMNVFEIEYCRLSVIGKGASGYAPQHRRRYPSEYFGPLFHAFPVMEVAAVIDSVKSGQITRIVDFLYIVMQAKTDDVHEASDAILMSKLRDAICPKLQDLVTLRIQGMITDLFVKAGLTMIDICKGHLASDFLRLASLRLGLLFQEPGDPLLYADPADVDFLDNTQHWIRGLDDDLVDDHQEFVEIAFQRFIENSGAVKLRDGYHEFATPADFESRILFENTMTGLGRALGLVIGYMARIRPTLLLRPVLDDALLKPVDEETIAAQLDLTRAERANPKLKSLAVMRKVYDPIFYVRRGIRETIGPMGVYALGEAVDAF